MTTCKISRFNYTGHSIQKQEIGMGEAASYLSAADTRGWGQGETEMAS